SPSTGTVRTDRRRSLSYQVAVICYHEGRTLPETIRDETIARGRPPPARGARPPLPPLPRPQGEDPLALDLAALPTRRAAQLRAGCPAGRALRRLRPGRPQALERPRPRRPGRPPQGQQEPRQAVPRPAGRGVRR